MYNILIDLSIKASEEQNTRGMQYQAQRTKPALDRA